MCNTYMYAHPHAHRNYIEYIVVTDQPSLSSNTTLKVYVSLVTVVLIDGCCANLHATSSPASLLNKTDHTSLSVLRPCPSVHISPAHVGKSKDLCVPDKYLHDLAPWGLCLLALQLHCTLYFLGLPSLASPHLLRHPVLGGHLQ